MTTKDFTVTLRTKQTPQQVFHAILNVRQWWSGIYSEEIKGNTMKLADEFDFRAGEGAHYSKQKLVELIPTKKVVWLVTESKLNFLEKQDEWTGTKLIFTISQEGEETKLNFTHKGLTPEIECYDSCAPAWTQYIQAKLLPLITTGKAK